MKHIIRLVEHRDLPVVAKIHRECFPESYSSQLHKYQKIAWGGDLLIKFLEEYFIDNPELFVVAEKDNQIVGYCMGYYMDNDNQMHKFIKHNKSAVIWRTLLLLLSGNTPSWKKLLSRLKKDKQKEWLIINDSNEHISNSLRGDLLSICVSSNYQGSGIATELIEFFLNSMKNHGKKLCLLSVSSHNYRAIRFYERNGFILYRLRGEDGRTYMKNL